MTTAPNEKRPLFDVLKVKPSIFFAIFLIFISCSSNQGRDRMLNLYNQGRELNKNGDYYKALLHFESSLRICRLSHFQDYIVLNLSEMGKVHYSLGKYTKALFYFNKAIKTAEKHVFPEVIGNCMSNIGSVYCALGEYNKALSILEKSLVIGNQSNNLELKVKCFNKIGIVYFHLFDYENALLWFKKALLEANKLNMHQQAAKSYNNIGSIYLIDKRYQDAKDSFHAAEFEIKKTNGQWRNLGIIEVCLATGKYAEALHLTKQITLNRYDSDKYRIHYFTLHGFALKETGRLAEASSEFLKAVLLLEEMRINLRPDERMGFMEKGFMGGYIRPYRGLTETLVARAINGTPDGSEFTSYGKDILSNAFYFSEMTKARTLLEAISKSVKGYESKDVNWNLKRKENEIINKLLAIEMLKETSRKMGEVTFLNLQRRKEELKKDRHLLISELRKKYPRYAALRYPKPIPPEELPLHEDEVLLEYELTEKAGYLFVVKNGDIKRLIKIPKGREEIEALVNEFISPLQSKYTIGRFSILEGQTLYDLLLKEALKDKFHDKKIIIIPDGILGLLPFEMLVEKKGKNYKDSEYVGDRWKITYSQSASVLALNRLLKPSEANKPLFALGNPIFNKNDDRYTTYKQGKDQPERLTNDTNRTGFRAFATRRVWPKTLGDDQGRKELVYPSLPETKNEVQKIADLFKVQPLPPDILLDISANETIFRQSQLKDYRYLHFATHADLPGNVQGIKEPFLLLGQVENKGNDDGFLTMTEVMQIHLDADMVVLSACLTGRGKVMDGEGVINFARAFQQAGARSVIVSLWEVASSEAVEYMKILYSHLKDGKGKAEALRLARKDIKEKYPNPYYWAVFILHGEG